MLGMESGGGPPHSKTLRATRSFLNNAKRLGLRQPSGALGVATDSHKSERACVQLHFHKSKL